MSTTFRNHSECFDGILRRTGGKILKIAWKLVDSNQYLATISFELSKSGKVLTVSGEVCRGKKPAKQSACRAALCTGMVRIPGDNVILSEVQELALLSGHFDLSGIYVGGKPIVPEPVLSSPVSPLSSSVAAIIPEPVSSSPVSPVSSSVAAIIPEPVSSSPVSPVSSSVAAIIPEPVSSSPVSPVLSSVAAIIPEPVSSSPVSSSVSSLVSRSSASGQNSLLFRPKCTKKKYTEHAHLYIHPRRVAVLRSTLESPPRLDLKSNNTSSDSDEDFFVADGNIKRFYGLNAKRRKLPEDVQSEEVRSALVAQTPQKSNCEKQRERVFPDIPETPAKTETIVAPEKKAVSRQLFMF